MHVTLAGRTLDLVGADGVFSASGLDKATAVFLDAVPTPPSGRVLDLGCGWGPIAISAALRQPDAHVWAVDVTARALDLTRDNARRAGVDIEVWDAAEACERARTEGIRFDAIWSNPPVRIGKDELRTLLTTWFSLLTPDGIAYFVMGRHLGADSMAAWLTEQGFPTQRIASKRGFRVLATRRDLA
nr:methyltransferase [Nanchangia anserum]